LLIFAVFEQVDIFAQRHIGCHASQRKEAFRWSGVCTNADAENAEHLAAAEAAATHSHSHCH